MKTKALLLLAVVLATGLTTQARGIRKNNESSPTAYKRSSLGVFMVMDTNRRYSDIIRKAFLSYPMPDKFNNQNLTNNRIIYSSIKKPTKGLHKGFTNDGNTATPELQIINQYIYNHNIAKRMVNEWFNGNENGFNMDLVAQRGRYNASILQAEIANNSIRGKALLSDAGEELIRNTFLIVNHYKFTNKKDVAKKVRNVLGLATIGAGLLGYDISTYTAIGAGAVTVAGKGYFIKCTSYLYRLQWNDPISDIFYTKYWNHPEAFWQSNLFKLDYIGSETAIADVQSSIFSKKSDSELIKIATIRATNKSIAKLQKTYEEFRTKTPLLNNNPLSAEIGLKEGVHKGERFEVLEEHVDENGRTSYQRKGIIKVDGSHIWDNRFMADEMIVKGKKSKAVGYNYTEFKGPKNKFYPGMLIRQISK